MSAQRGIQLPLLGITPVLAETISNGDGNALLAEWGHRLGPCRRPFRVCSYALLVDGEPVSLAMSASAVSAIVADFRRDQVVELARLCSAPGQAWASRVMIRLWREVFAQCWPDWPVEAAISYSQNAHHRGDLYRFDGWEKVRDDCGSDGGGTYTKRRAADHPARGPKSLWVWRYSA